MKAVEAGALGSVAECSLVYDFGVQDGKDSAYYLTRSARVIGVDASPAVCEAMKAKFAREIAEGRYQILNVGVAEARGRMTFWVCDTNPEWSSFDKALAMRGADFHAVEVATMTSQEIFAEFGAPDFVKIDIEGHDKVCLAALTPETAPPYISVELGHPDGGELIALLTGLGYRRFKIVSQRTMTAPLRLLIALAYVLPDRPRWWLRHFDAKFRGVPQDRGWRFAFGASGAFGERAAGRWTSAGAAMRTWRFLKWIDDRLDGGRGLVDWFDIHATR